MESGESPRKGEGDPKASRSALLNIMYIIGTSCTGVAADASGVPSHGRCRISLILANDLAERKLIRQELEATGQICRALQCGDLPCQFRLTNHACQFKLTGMDFEELSVNLSSDDPAIGLRASLALHRLAERVEAKHVASAREKGWSWQQIGDALGVTRQSVHTKYNRESS
jgi:hypothetical protein